MNRRLIAEQIFREGIDKVLPGRLIPKVMDLNNNNLRIDDLYISLETIRNIYVIGAGKASALMGAEVEKILGDKIKEGHIVVKYGHSCKLKHITVSEAGHPVPDSRGFKATGKILSIAEKAVEDDLVICLISGGGSALLADFPEGSSQEDIMKLNNLLVNSGASITEINAVRKHLSAVKGGQLARAVYPAMLVSLLLSDVTGDPLDVIASGPTTPDPTTFRQAIEVLNNFNLRLAVPESIIKYLQKGYAGLIPETPKPGDPVFDKVRNFIIGNNRTALEAARKMAIDNNINGVIIDDKLQGDIESVAGYIFETAINFKNDSNEVKPVCLLFGGETTVKMEGKGRGGRNQHLALIIALLLKDHPGITVLCAGTDGTDGPTDAAGAVVDSETMRIALSRKIDPEIFLRNFDSWHFFKKAGGHIITGPTMTNVMDIITVIIDADENQDLPQER